MKERSKILVYLFGSLGDTIVAIPALRAARRHFPDSEFVLLQNVHSGDFVKASEVVPDGMIDRYINYSNDLSRAGKIVGLVKTWLTLRQEKFDAVVYLVISERPERSVARDRLFFRFCGIRELIGFHGFSEKELYPADSEGLPAMTPHEADRKLSRLQRDGVEIVPEEDFRVPFFLTSQSENERAAAWLSERRRRPESKLIAIAPGCKTISNQWPLENFAQLGRSLISEVNCELIVVGGPGERQWGDKLVEAWGSGMNAAGSFSIKESAALLEHCDIYVGLDTGSTHLAAVQGVRCFAIYGERNNPGQWYPMGPANSVIRHPVICAGCRSFECLVEGHPCVSGISVDSVLEHLRTFIEPTPGQIHRKLVAV